MQLVEGGQRKHCPGLVAATFDKVINIGPRDAPLTRDERPTDTLADLGRTRQRTTRLGERQPRPPSKVCSIHGAVSPRVAGGQERERLLVPALPLRDARSARQLPGINDQVLPAPERTRQTTSW